MLTKSSQIDILDAPAPIRESFLLASRSVLYVSIILAVVFVAAAYSLRHYGIFSCSASGYGSDAYLGYCGATSYGDYDHGAIWFGLEPAANAAAVNAQVLFLGNSRTQFGFSSKATDEWFSSISASYYLLGFSHFENYTFEGPLLGKLHPRAKVYIINVDSFFDQSQTGPSGTVMRDESAQNRYAQKRSWQTIHKAICGTIPGICGNALAIFRSRRRGAWLATGDSFTSDPVTYEDNIDRKKVASYVESGKQFLPQFAANHACVLLTVVPTVGTDIGTAKAIAAALGLDFAAPRLSGLMTFDHYHLNRESAERWSAAFLADAGPQIRRCLNE